jgi:hypothetical protein
MIEMLGWVASLLAMVGTTLDAANCRRSRWRFAFYLAANLCLVRYAIGIGSRPLIFQFGLMTLSSALGMWRWRKRREWPSRAPQVRFAE